MSKEKTAMQISIERKKARIAEMYTMVKWTINEKREFKWLKAEIAADEQLKANEEREQMINLKLDIMKVDFEDPEEILP